MFARSVIDCAFSRDGSRSIVISSEPGDRRSKMTQKPAFRNILGLNFSTAQFTVGKQKEEYFHQHIYILTHICTHFSVPQSVQHLLAAKDKFEKILLDWESSVDRSLPFCCKETTQVERTTAFLVPLRNREFRELRSRVLGASRHYSPLQEVQPRQHRDWQVLTSPKETVKPLSPSRSFHFSPFKAMAEIHQNVGLFSRKLFTRQNENMASWVNGSCLDWCDFENVQNKGQR